MMRFEDCLYLDVETTGLDCRDEVIGVAILDYAGNVLLHTPVRPVLPGARMSGSAYRTHGIRLEDLKDAPSWSEIHEQVKNIIGSKHVVVFGRIFESNMLCNTIAYQGLKELAWAWSVNYVCAQKFCGEALGFKVKRMSLKVAAERAGVSNNYQFRRALTSAQVMLNVVKVIVENRIPPRVPKTIKRRRRILDDEYDEDSYGTDYEGNPDEEGNFPGDDDYDSDNVPGYR